MTTFEDWLNEYAEEAGPEAGQLSDTERVELEKLYAKGSDVVAASFKIQELRYVLSLRALAAVLADLGASNAPFQWPHWLWLTVTSALRPPWKTTPY